MKHLIVLRADGPNRFIAHPAGIPELQVEATSQQSALDQVARKLTEWLQSGQVKSIDLQEPTTPAPSVVDNSVRDELEEEYIREIARGRQELDEQEGVWNVDPSDTEAVRQVEESRRARREELKGTIWDYEIPCPTTSSTPTS